MALLLTAASSQHLEATTAAVTVKPLTLAAWCKTTTFAGQQGTLISLMTSATANRHFAIGTQTVGQAFVVERGNISASGNHGSSITNGVWCHIGGTFAGGATGARTPWFNGAAGTGITTSVGTPPVPDRTSIGAYNVSVAATPASFLDGAIAEAAIWNVELTAPEMASLAAGIRPIHVRPSALVFYAPFMNDASPGIDIRGARSLVWTGTPTLTSHPPILGSRYRQTVG